MILARFDKFTPLKSGEITVQLTVQRSDFDALIPLMRAGRATLGHDQAQVQPESQVVLQNVAEALSRALDQIRTSMQEVPSAEDQDH